MKIKNLTQLAQSSARRAALEIIEAGLEAIDTEAVMRRTVRVEEHTLVVDGERIDLERVRRLIVVGVGKCAARAAAELERILGEKISAGFIIAIGDVPPLRHITVRHGTHPFPSQVNMEASKELLKTVSGLAEEDLVLALVTGGGSTLLCLPDDGNWQRESLIFGAFMNAGAPIQEINTVRKHMSRARGGFLAQAMYPARVVSLIFNDVPGSEDIGFIASGPTVKDVTTEEDAAEVLARHSILQACNLDGCGLIETPKDEKYFKNVKNIVVVSNTTALDAMANAARTRGYEPLLKGAMISGEAREFGARIAVELENSPAKSALLYGGETTVTVHGPGKGGRNQELVLSALADIPEGGVLVAASSDGHDNGEFAGALCDKITQERARSLGLSAASHLERSASSDFWNAAGDYLLMGDTGSNVSDLIIALKD